MTYTQALETTYANSWRGGEAALRAGTYRPDPLPTDGENRWGLSVVLSVVGEPVEPLVALAEEIRESIVSSHLVYGRESLHSTVRSLTGYSEKYGDADVAQRLDELEQATRGIGPFEVRLDGLSGSAGGVFACGYPDAALTEIRARLLDIEEHRGGAPGGDRARSRDSAHVSLVVFREPAVPENALADLIAANRQRSLGVLRVERIQLASWQVSADAVVIRTHAVVDLR